MFKTWVSVFPVTSADVLMIRLSLLASLISPPPYSSPLLLSLMLGCFCTRSEDSSSVSVDLELTNHSFGPDISIILVVDTTSLPPHGGAGPPCLN